MNPTDWVITSLTLLGLTFMAWVLIDNVGAWVRGEDVYEHEADCSWAIGESDECSCGLDDQLLPTREQQ